jgi:hypothetical protein
LAQFSQDISAYARDGEWMMMVSTNHTPGQPQKTPNDPSALADQKNNPSAVVPHSIITGRSGFAKRCETAVMNVLVIEPLKNKI